MRKRIFFISLSIVTFIGILSLIGYILPYKPEGELTTLDGPWDIDTVDVHIKDASVDEVSEVLSSLHKGLAGAVVLFLYRLCKSFQKQKGCNKPHK